MRHALKIAIKIAQLKICAGGPERLQLRFLKKIYMSNYQDLLARKRALDKSIEQRRRAESVEALATIQQLIATFGFTAQQVFPFQPTEKKKVAAKYYDAATGKSWTGRGRLPKWLEGKDLEAYAIAAPKSETEAQTFRGATDANNPFPIQ